VFAFRSPALAACLPHQDYVWITIDLLVPFHKNKFDEMLCKLDRLGESAFVQEMPDPTLRNAFGCKIRWESPLMLIVAFFLQQVSWKVYATFVHLQT